MARPTVARQGAERLQRRGRLHLLQPAPDLRAAVEHGVPDTIVQNPATFGGIRPTMKFIAACEAMGIGFWFYSGDTGIGTAVYLHMSAACPWIKDPHQSLLRWQPDDVIVGGTFLPEHGVVRVPEGPGLGVELDRSALARAKKRFETEGPLNPFGQKEGQYARLPNY